MGFLLNKRKKEGWEQSCSQGGLELWDLSYNRSSDVSSSYAQVLHLKLCSKDICREKASGSAGAKMGCLMSGDCPLIFFLSKIGIGNVFKIKNRAF